MVNLLRRKHFTLYLVFCVYLLCPSLLLSATLSGTLSENETWSGNVQLTGDVTVPVGLTLTISPGAIVEFPAALDDRSSGADTSRSELIIQGSLVAIGTSSIPITFTSSSSIPAKNDWVGLRVLSRGTADIAYAIIEYAANGIDYSLSSGMGEMSVTNCLIHKLSGIGIKTTVSNANTVFNGTFIGNEITETDGNGMYLYTHTSGRSELEISGNVIHHVAGYGVYLYGNNSTRINGVIADNQISYTGTGVYQYNYYGTISDNITYLNNTIHNTGTGLYFYTYHNNVQINPVISGNHIYDNSSYGIRVSKGWGSSSIVPQIYDNSITNNSIGIQLEGGGITPEIIFNTITGNTSIGLSLASVIRPVIFYNDIQGNGGTGILLNSSGTAYVHYNNISNESIYELQNNSGSAVDARYNWWGASATAQMDGADNPQNITRIYDIFDDRSKGNIDYSEWLNSVQTLTTAPISHIIEPVDGLQSKSGTIIIKGIASATAGINYIEVSVDDGQSWQTANGETRWSYSWENPDDGSYIIKSRVIDSDGDIELPGAGHTVIIDSTLPTTSGTLISDENWSGEIFLTGDVTVPEHVKLSIAAGSTIRFQALSDDRFSGLSTSRTELIVRGSLNVSGTTAAPVIFTSSSSSPARNDWVGIRVLSRGNLNLNYATIEYAANGIDYSLSSGMGEMTVTNCLIHQLSGIGIKTTVANANTVFSGTFIDNEIAETNGNGMYLYTHTSARSEFDIVGNAIHHVAGYGIHLYGNNSTRINGLITDNEISYTDTGVYQYNYYGAVSEDIIYRNNTIHNTATGLYFYTYHNNVQIIPVISGNHIYDNSSYGIRLNKGWGSSSIVPQFYNNSITDNSTGIQLEGGGITPKIIFNTITDNGMGLSLASVIQPIILYNDIQRNSSTGILLNSSGTAYVHYNNISNEYIYELQNNSGAAVDARYNWWGNTATTQMNAGNNPKNISRIFDIFDNGTKGSVDYNEWLSEIQTLTVGSVSRIIEPVNGLQSKGGTITVTGIASAPAEIDHVEVSVDNGLNWHVASGKTRWSYSWENPGDGDYILFSRIIDQGGDIEIPGAGHSVTINSTLPTTSGRLSSDENWSGEIILTGDITVPEYVKLNIAAGTILRFQALSDDQSLGIDSSRSELIIEGSLIAHGTSTAPIIFTSSSSSPAKNDWVGIRVLSRGNLSLSYATIEYAANGIDYSLSSGMGEMSVMNCLIHQLSGIGIKTTVANSNTVFSGTFIDNEIAETNGNGMYLYTHTSGRSELDIVGNAIHHVAGYGIHLYGNNSARIDGLIADNEISHTGTGIYQYNYYGTVSQDIAYKNNTIHDTATGLYLYTYHNNVQIIPVISDNHIYDNSAYGIRLNKGWGSSSIVPLLYNNSITNNSTGIHLEGGGITPKIIFNAISDNTVGLSLAGVIQPVILYNDIQGNDSPGILLNSSGTAYVHYNNISNDHIYELQNNSGAAVDARYNWWGAVATFQMDTGNNPKNITRIFDIFDDASKGSVDYSEWLSGTQALAVELVSRIIEPVNGLQSKGGILTITGIASATAGIDYVEVSVDDGQSWHVAAGKTRWSYFWENPVNGSYAIQSRVTDLEGNIEMVGTGHSVIIDSTLPTTSGSLSGDENWSGEIVLTGDVIVPENITLNIAAGTTIRFQALSDDQSSGLATSRSELIVQGALVAGGTSTGPITFTSSSSSPAKNDWIGIRVLSGGSLNLTYATIEYAANGIDYSLSSGTGGISVANCLIHQLSGIGIKTTVANANTVFTGAFTGNVITETDGSGMYLYTHSSAKSGLEITGNIVHHVAKYGIHLYGNNSARIDGLIAGNEISHTGTGVYQYNYYGTVSQNITYKNNTIHDTDTGLYLYTYHNNVQIIPVITGNHIYANSLYGIHINKGWGSSSIVPLLYDNRIADNNIGIHLEGGGITPEIIFNTIIDNVSIGLSLASVIQPVILHNDIQGNGGTGILLNSSGTAYVHYNNINNVHIYELQNNSGAAVDARYNWWGNSATIQMAGGNNPEDITRIHDIFDDGSKGSVDYSQWLSDVQTLITKPASRIIEPVNDLQSKGGTITIKGIASATAGVDYVEVSVDAGQTWDVVVNGKTRWSYSWENPANGSYLIQSRVIDLEANFETPGAGHAVIIDSALPTTSGILINDENWSGEVILTGDITIPENITLNIAAGTTIRFQALSDDQSSGSSTSRIELIVRGNLNVSGTTAAPVTFTSSSLSPAKNDWVGIRVFGRGTIDLDYATIEYAANGIDYSLSSGTGGISVMNCLIHQLSGIGIRTTVANANTLFNGTFIGNEIAETNGNGMYLYTHTSGRSELEISGNTIHHVTGYGIHLYGNNSARIDGLIADNEISHTGTGVYQYNYYGTVSRDISYKNNTIHDTATGLYLYTYHNNVQMIPIISDNHIYDNSLYGIRLNKGWGSSSIVPQFYNNSITNNSIGIHLEGGGITPKIIFNTITYNANIGLSLASVIQPIILHNDIQGNTNTGILLNSSGTAYVHYNNISNKHIYELQNNSGAAVDGRYNWWGDSATAQMNSGDNPKDITRIFDIFDNGTKGSVDYSEWLSGAQDLAVKPLSRVIEPINGLQSKGGTYTITGIASTPVGIDYVEISVDNGQNWYVASGTTRWSYVWQNPTDGNYVLVSRIIDLDGNIETSGAGNNVTIDSTLPTTSGSLSGDENWSGEIILTGDVTVPENITLNIAAGTTIRFQALSDDQSTGIDTSRSELIIQGSLTTVGTALAPITFGSSALNPAKNDWTGIRVLGRGTINLEHSIIEYAANGIDYSLSSGVGEISVVNCLIHKLSGIGIKTTVANANTVFTGTLVGNEINDTDGNGIYLYTHTSAKSGLEITGNTINNVSGYGIYLYGNNSARIDGTIADNEVSHTGTGIYQYNYYGTVSQDITYKNNTIHDTATGLYLYTYHNNVQIIPVISGNHIYDNSLYGIRVNKGWGSSSIVPLFHDNSISNNSNGVHLEGGNITPEFIFNTITGNSNIGLSLANVIQPVILYNDIQGNGSTGLLLNSSGTAYVHYNNISNEHTYELQNNSGAAVDARYNWWGAPATVEMDGGNNPKNIGRIYDIFDNGSKGSVDYSEWLSSTQILGTEPISHIIEPLDGLQSKGGTIIVKGIASATAGIDHVEISVDNGRSWQLASGKTRWSYSWENPADGDYYLLSRVIDLDTNIETAGTGHTVTVDSGITQVSGTLISDETWSGQILLVGDVTVPIGITLTIQPGTDVKVAPLHDAEFSGTDSSKIELIVYGTLLIEARENETVSFSSNAYRGGLPGDWVGISIRGTLFGDYLVIEHAETPISFIGDSEGDRFSLKNSVIRKCTGAGLRLTASGGQSYSALVETNSIIETGGDGIDLKVTNGSELDIRICANSLASGGTNGIYAAVSGGSGTNVLSGIICENSIFDYATVGINLYTYYTNSISQLVVDGNSIHHVPTSLQAKYNRSSAGSTLEITNNKLYSGQAGIIIRTDYASLAPIVINNEIHEHSVDGLRTELGSSATMRPQIDGNQIFHNARYGISLQVSEPVSLRNNSLDDNFVASLYNNSALAIDAKGNWWGVDTLNEINSGVNPQNLSAIYDVFDNGARGEVDYSDWLVLYDPPGAPTLDAVISPTVQPMQTLSGTKDADSGIIINTIQRVAPNQETTWSYAFPLIEGKNSLNIKARAASGMVSSSVQAHIVVDTTAPLLYSSSPADGAFVTREVRLVEMTILEQTTEIDAAATAQGTMVDGSGQTLPGSWAIENSHLTFTPDTPLQDGTYTLTLHPTDHPLGNSAEASITFSVDLGPPLAPVIADYVSPRSDSRIVISGTKEINSAVWINGREVVALNDALVWSDVLSLTEGANVFQAYCRDQAGNNGEITSFTVTLDTAPPQFVSTVPSDNSYTNVQPPDVRFTFNEITTSIDEIATLASADIFTSKGGQVQGTWSLLDGKVVIFTPSQSFIEELYSLQVTARDILGNATHASLAFTYDSTPPSTPTVGPVQSPTSFIQQTLSGTKEGSSSIRINSTVVFPVNEQTTWSHSLRLAEGDNNFVIDSVDKAGNISSSVSTMIHYDETAPLSVDTLILNGEGSGTTVFLDWTGYNEAIQGDVAYYRIYLRDSLFTQVGAMTPVGTVSAGTFTYTATGLSRNGLYYFAVIAVDDKENAHSSVTPVSVRTKDIAAPEPAEKLTALAVADSLTFSWQPSVNSAGDLAGYLFSFNNEAAVELDSTITSQQRTALPDATAYPCSVIAVDGDGNRSEAVSVTGVTLLPNPAGVVITPYDGYVSIGWNLVEPADYVKQYAVYVSETPFTSIAGKYHRLISREGSAKVAWLTNGTEYYFAVATVNISNGSKQELISYPSIPSDDQQGPAFGIITVDGLVVADGMSLIRSVEIRAEAADPISVSRVEFRVDGVLRSVDYLPTPDYAWFWDIQNSSDGSHILTLVAYDSLGNSSEISFSVNIQLAPPVPPVFTAPAAGYLTNKPVLLIAGEADPNTTVSISSNESEIAAGIVVDGSGSFSAEIILTEGENRLVARALNRAGASAPSAEHQVILDTSIPDAPANLTATPRSGGRIKLDWTSLKGEEVTGHNVYRSFSTFSEIDQGDKLNNGPVKDTDYTDLTPEDGTWYYRVTTVDLAGNEGIVSGMVQAVADRVPPKALSVTVDPHGKSDGSRIGPGLLDLTVTLSEPLQAAPFVSIIPEGGTPHALRMQQKDAVTWQGSYTILETTPSGTAYILFSGRDIAGNRGTDIETGAVLLLDTDGPEVVRLQVIPTVPINNDDQPEIRVVLGMAEEVKAESVPILSYRLSAPGSAVTVIDNLVRVPPQSGEAEAWQAMFILPAGAGLDGAETLSFIFEAQDDLENISTKISAYNQFQIYQGSLPPLATPVGLTARAIPEGKVTLAWEMVEDAIGYQLYRKQQGETEMQQLTRLTDMAYEDRPGTEDLWFYSVSSIREVDGMEAESGQSTIVSVQTDATPPPAPKSLILQLTPQGIMLEWLGEVAGSDSSYTLYRSAAREISSVAGMDPLVAGIGQTMVIDPTPSPTDHCYVITAVDKVGNESFPSNSAYQNFGLLPVSGISIIQSGAEQPVLSWSHPNNAKLSGYTISLQQGSGDVNLVTPQPLPATRYVDNGYTGDERTYIINAVDENGVISLGRSLFMPMLRTEILPDEKLERGIMNALTLRVKNLGKEDVAGIWLEVTVGGKNHISEKFDLQSGEYSMVPVIIGGYDSLPDLAEITIKTIISPHPGETVRFVRSTYVDVSDGMLILQFGNEEFVRGVTGSVWFRLENSGDEEIEIITAAKGGNTTSTTLRYKLVDSDANVLVTAPFRQVGTEDLVTLPNSNVVARIQPGNSFTSQPTIIEIPSGVPDELFVRLVIDKVSYHQGREDEVLMQGLTGEFAVRLADTSYYGTITSISPEASFGDQDVIITGRAIERDSSGPLGLAPLKLVISLEGFERATEVMTDEDGLFSYTFTPLAGESGRYQVRAVHPDLLDKPVHGEFVIQLVIVRPTTINLSIPRNYEQRFYVEAATGIGTTLTNLQLLYLPEDQEGEMLPEGVNLTPGAVVPYVGEQSTAKLQVLLWADNRAADSGRLKLRLISDESDADGWGVITVNTAFSTASPVLTFSPNHIETGVVLDDMVTENITLGNTGLAALENVQLSLKTLEGMAAPSWLHLGIKPEVGDIEVGEERDVVISFSPGQDIDPGPYQFKLLVRSDNYSDTTIYLFVIVDQDGQGNVLFKVSDIYTGTLNKLGERIEGLAGAAITLQNEATLVTESVSLTDGLGEVEFSDLSVGWYKYRITATNHQEQIGRIIIKPGLTAARDIFLDYNLVTVSWEVKEITIEDKYEIILTATFETDVPAAVVVAEPTSLTLPELRTGMVYNGEFTLTNYGIIRADDLGFELPADDANFRYELLDGMPDSLAAGESITVAYRVTCLKGLDQEDGSGGGCYTYNRCLTIPYTYKCANDVRTSSRTGYCWTYSYGVCSVSSVSSVSGAGSWTTISFSGPSSYTTSSPVPLPQKLAGEECLGKCNCKPATPPSCPTGVCPLPENYVTVGSIVDTRLREYSRDTKDLTVSIPGGSLSVHRYYELGQWLWEFNRDNLTFESNSQGVVEAIIKNGVSYENSSGAPDLFRFQNELIVLVETGYRWSDRSANWMEYDTAGRLLAYGLRDDTIARALYESNTFAGWLDRNDNQILWYTYQNDQLISVTDADGRIVEYSYSSGLLYTVKNLRGNLTSYNYANDRLSRVEEPGGKVRNIIYNKYGDVISVRNDEGVGHTFEYDYDKGTREYYAYTKYPSGKVREVWYNYDGDVVRVDINGLTVKSIKYGARVKWVTDERGYTSRYDLDEWDNEVFTLYPDDSWVEKNYSHPWNLLTSVNRMGIITEYEYDVDGNRSAMIEAQGTDVERRTEFIYNDSGKVISSILKGGVGEIDAVTRFSYDEYDRLLIITDPENRLITFSDYDEGANPQTVENGRGIKQYFNYDAEGNLLTVHDHDNKLINEYRYDAGDNRTSVLNAYLKEYSFVYDGEQNLVSIGDPVGGSSTREYSPAGKPTTVTDQEGNSTTYVYDLFERVERVIDPEGNIITSVYDAAGDCSSCSGGVDLATSIVYPTFTREMSYDSRKRLTGQKDIYDDRERFTSYGYDEFGNMQQVVDPEGNVTTYEYDALGRKVSEVDAQGNTTRFSYDGRDNLVTLQDGNGGFTWFEYDLSSRLIKETKPLLQETGYSYDGAGNLVAMTDANGRRTVYAYDNSNRLVKSEIYAAETDAEPAKSINYSYNDAGSLIGYDDAATSATYVYDDLQRRISEKVNYGTFSLTHGYSYYGNGWKKDYTDPAGRIKTYSYDKAGKPLGVDLGAAGQVSYNGYSWNRPSRITLPGGASLNFDYSGLQQVTAIVGKDPAENPVIDYGYSYSSSGNIIEKNTGHGDYSYGYDSLYRLTGVKGVVEEESFGYDPLANRKSSADFTDWSYNDNNQLIGYGATAFKYDNHGNMVEKTVPGRKSGFVYGVDNRLEKITDDSGAAIATYYYDPYGRRLWKEVAGIRTCFHYNDEGLVGEYDATGNELRIYGYLPDSPWSTNPLFVQIEGVYYWYQNDHLGTPQKIIAGNGVLVWQGMQDAFGRMDVVVEDITNNLRFPGQYFDGESGLYYNWHRYYDPGSGRYISADPIGLGGGINLYAYVGGDPVNLVDPWGLWPYYRRWGGPNHTAGRKGSWDTFSETFRQDIRRQIKNGWDPGSIFRPEDDQDTCYMHHDICYGDCVERCKNDPCSEECIRKGLNKCDRDLSDCLIGIGFSGDPLDEARRIASIPLFKVLQPLNRNARAENKRTGTTSWLLMGRF